MPKPNFKNFIPPKSLNFLIFLFLISLPAFAWADLGVPEKIVTCGTGAKPCEVCDLYEGVHNLIDLLLFGLTLPAATLAIIAAGVIWLISAGSPEKITLGKNILWYAGLGILVAFGAWLIVNTILSTLAFKNPFDQKAWSDFSFCEKFKEAFQAGETKKTTTTTTATTVSKKCDNCVTLSVPYKVGACKGTATGQVCQVDKTLNDRLVDFNRDIINDGKISYGQVSEAWPPTVTHKDECHGLGTCVDWNFISSSAKGNAKDITYLVDKADKFKLRAVYEVADDIRKKELEGRGIPSKNIQTVAGIKTEHFSIYLK